MFFFLVSDQQLSEAKLFVQLDRRKCEMCFGIDAYLCTFTMALVHALIDAYTR